ncbi:MULTISPECIES: BglG family transcription antiterminator [unclassified Breznakia]|uniref:BglG family transcription antiterminator n=1 Tax=unclassified Breznakia TaxID=2623764 RepID=UPI00247654A2|nr:MULTISPECIES: BglG family transcription antiterminator [unclassified Breznakia]MDH6366225.1 mannitol operon transcriptional antiterminator [Breznakia sp. PH1-1]MDH6403318.1 mannitol operon transcriptional antiterminator [Breznakia sp. PF1-11]MDH6411027.1 mannitol operon transcriptional antiterminator [Breznakia sp. PFB1-11]MDH6413391.1 mannitol operon transcriptional antiterminator [Breznakia sp. PFB1-14]MDH6416156.1 mannitol operon transcriptional antiterminator [Breznakia sp. PFB1-4]
MIELDTRCQELLNTLLQSEVHIKIQEIVDEKQISKRSVYYDLCKINDFLASHNIEEVTLERSKGINLSQKQKEQIRELMYSEPLVRNVYFSPSERVLIIICMILQKDRPLLIEDFIDVCQVSRNTIINDLKVASTKLQEYGLTLKFENKTGYIIQGDIIRKRALFFLYFPELISYYHTGALSSPYQEQVEENLKKFDYIEKTLDTQYVRDTLVALAHFVPVLGQEDESFHFTDIDKNKIMDTYEYTLVQRKFHHLVEDECIYLTLHLLGSRLEVTSMEINDVSEDQEAYDLATSLVSEFSRLACVEFENKEVVERSIFVHLKASLYRYRYGIQIGNPLINDVKGQYPELFEITKKAAEYLAQQIGVPIADNEIAYLTLHFGGFISTNQTVDQMNILIICPNGISTGNMLRAEVSTLIPHADTIDVVALRGNDISFDDYQVVISTVEVPNCSNCIIVHPILSDADRVMILRKCMRTSGKGQIRADDVLEIVKKYVKEEDHQALKIDLQHYLESLTEIRYHPLQDGSRGMLSFLNEETIYFHDEDYDWQEAIRLSSEPLVEKKSITTDFVDAMIRQTRKMGPYMFINDHVVLAHAKPEDGVVQLDFNMNVFESGVYFPKQRMAKVILVLAAEDKVKHLKILKDVMHLFSNEEIQSEILACKNAPQMLQVIGKALKA